MRTCVVYDASWRGPNVARYNRVVGCHRTKRSADAEARRLNREGTGGFYTTMSEANVARLQRDGFLGARRRKRR